MHEMRLTVGWKQKKKYIYSLSVSFCGSKNNNTRYDNIMAPKREIRFGRRRLGIITIVSPQRFSILIADDAKVYWYILL